MDAFQHDLPTVEAQWSVTSVDAMEMLIQGSMIGV
jgi:hypothetical protein